jgi:phenylalanyl-tRNA synthetase beta chain
MKVSINWAQQVSNVDLKAIPTDELVARIGAQLGEIEAVTYWEPRYDGIIVAKIVSCEKHGNADKLHVCRVDDGGAAQNVVRGDDGLVQVVCGAPNARAGITVAWLPPGSTVPSSIDKEPFVLEARDIRGEMSNGMLASPHELGISDNHDGILEIDTIGAGEELSKPGTPFKQLYGLDDVVIDIENKMFTHRPDCFGILGVARELAGITGQAFVSPDWYLDQAASDLQQAVSGLQLQASNEIPDKVPRFSLQVIENVRVQSSPTWMQCGLTRIGIRPINNLVDLSNFYMQLTAQPTHAFDYDKVKALSGGDTTIMPRMAIDGEELLLLNGKTIKLTKDDIVIATNKQAIGLAGIMGGAETEVDDTTKNIVVESACFDMYTIRRSSMRHGLFSDATTRFTKGQSPLQTTAVLAKISNDIVSSSGGTLGTQIDLRADTVQPAAIVKVTAEFINARLGSQLNAEHMATLLKNVEFGVDLEGEELVVSPPFWRTDIEIPEDIVEEVGRLHGYDNLPMILPTRSIKPVALNRLMCVKDDIRSALSRAGASESLGYSFVHGNLLDKVDQDKTQAFQVANALSPDLQYYRMSLTPSLLEKTQPNIRAGYDQFALFEIGKAHIKGEPDVNEPEVPKEVNALSFVFAADAKACKTYHGAAYYQAKKYLDNLLDNFGFSGVLKLEKLAGADLYQNPWIIQMTAPYDGERSAVLRAQNGLIWGVVGEFKQSVRRSLKLPDFVAGFELDPLLFMASDGKPNYQALPKFPKIEQDMTLKVPAGLSYAELYQFVWDEMTKLQPEETLPTLTPVDIYQREDDKDHKNVSLRLVLSAYNRTLKTEEVNNLLDQVASKAKDKFGAERL